MQRLRITIGQHVALQRHQPAQMSVDQLGSHRLTGAIGLMGGSRIAHSIQSPVAPICARNQPQSVKGWL
jgi:hypothetical protein